MCFQNGGPWLALILLSCLAPAAQGWEIKLSANPSKQDQAAATDLQNYLERVATSVTVDGREVKAFRVGDGEFAAAHGVAPKSLKPDSWVIKSVGDQLLLIGGGYRGSSYAVYHFLEDFLGVRWFSPLDEYAPPKQDWRFAGIHVSGKPGFELRGVFNTLGYPKEEYARFIQRNRLDDIHSRTLRGPVSHGSPHLVHTFDTYVPAKEFLEKKPEYFSLVDGKRYAGQRIGQLCLSHPEVREIFKKKVKEYIVKDEEWAAKEGVDAPRLYSITQNDSNRRYCRCEKCEAFMREHGNQTDLLVAFTNDIAAEVKKFRPDCCVQMLAYTWSENPPKTVFPADNVVVWLADVEGVSSQSVLDPSNEWFRNLTQEWSKISRQLHWWVYWMKNEPIAMEQNLPVDMEFAIANKVSGYFAEILTDDMHDYQVWMLAKFMEDPLRKDFDDLTKTYMSGMFGPEAGSRVAAARRRIADKVRKDKVFFPAFGQGAIRYLDMDTAAACASDFEAAEKALTADPVRLQRLNLVRFSFDRLFGLALPRYYMNQWDQSGRDRKAFPLDLEKARQRAIATAELLMQRSQGGAKWRLGKWGIAKTYDLPLAVPEPARFKGQRYWDITAEFADYGQIVKDPEAETTYAIKLPLSDPKRAKEFELPFNIGFDVLQVKGHHQVRRLEGRDLGKGYQWHRLPNLRPHAGAPNIVYLASRWVPSITINDLPTWAGQKTMDAHFRLKFVGPAFHPGEEGESAVYFERVVMVPASE